MYFVYTKINGKIWPQKWTQIPVYVHSQKPRDENVVFKKELTDKEKNMTLSELVVTYPYQSQNKE